MTFPYSRDQAGTYVNLITSSSNSIAGHKAERRPGAGEEWLAATQHDGVEVESILIDKTKIGQASRQFWSGDFNLPDALSLQPPYHRLEVIPDERGVGAD